MATEPRRQFLKQAVLGSSGLLLLRHAPAARAATTAKIEVLPDEPIGTISPDLYGHFTEHIGGVVYDGIWVGEDSKIPNIGGIRKELVEHMRRIKPSVVRWPGGCFADSYNWRDGVGPREKRPRRPNFWINDPFLKKAPDGPTKYDTNEFGTDEFVRFCRLIGAEPYLAVNARETPELFYQWVEYCNAPAGTTTLADQRVANGEADPMKVRFWGVGNESWGCGGNYTPEEYAMEYSRFVAWVPDFGVDLALIAAGPSGSDVSDKGLDWTRGFFTQMTVNRFRRQVMSQLYGWALHYYSATAGEGQAVDFTNDDWYVLIKRADRMEELIRDHWALMGEFDENHQVKLIVDEWGAWHRQGSEVNNTHLFGQTSTMRDALVAALTLDTFNRHSDKVVMGNIAQLINNLQSLFLAHEDQFIATPNFHVFEMYAAHHNGKALRTEFESPSITLGTRRPGPAPTGWPIRHQLPLQPTALWGLEGSASLHDKQLVLTAVNPSITEARETEIVVRGARIESARASVLAESDIHAHNSFDNPGAVTPKEAEVGVSAGKLVYSFPPASVVRLSCALA
jgi:alpha-N-arabinofuranosidase